MHVRPRDRRLRLETLEDRCLLAGDFELLADVNAEPASYSSSPRHFVSVGATTFFLATTGNEGVELWKTDGTAEGTALVKDINPGAANGVLDAPLVAFNGAVYFQANDGSSGAELWRSDGSEAGTVRVKDVAAGSGSSTPTALTEFNGSLYFTSTSGLYKTDGTEVGTVHVKAVSAAGGLIKANGQLYFRSGTSFVTLWKSDGTAAGTTGVTSGTMFPSFTAGTWAEVGGVLYFQALAAGGFELWKTDGTPAGTMRVKDVFDGPSHSSPTNLVNFEGTLYFQATDLTHGRELWKSDGTEMGTMLAHELATATRHSFSTSPSSNNRMLVHDGRLYFGTSNLGNGALGAPDALWAIDDPGAAPVQLTPSPGVFSGGADLVGRLTVFQNMVYFSAPSGFNVTLWKTDGTALGTSQASDVGPVRLHAAGDVLYISGSNNNTTGIELFRSDGTGPGTELVKDLRISTADADPSEFVRSGGFVYFRADDGVHGKELWRTDGTAAGTSLVADLRLGAVSSDPNELVDVNGVLFFSATVDLSFQKLHRVDPSLGAVQVLDAGGNSVAVASQMVSVGGRVYFVSYTADEGYELWTSDGTPSGTHQVSNSMPGPNDGVAQGGMFGQLGDMLFFGAYHPDYGYELWRTDGMEADAQLAEDIGPGTDGVAADNFTVLDGQLYFIARDMSGNRSLWRTDGTGAELISAINPRDSSSYPNPYLTAVDGTLYFSALSHPNGGDEVIWRMNAPGTGVEIAADVSPFFDVDVYGLVGHEGALYFISDGFSQDDGLWRYDGAAPSEKIFPNSFSEGDLPTPINGGTSLYFIHRTSIADEEGVVYELDGRLGTFATVAGLPTASSLAAFDGVIFAARHFEPYGREIWVSRPAPGDYSVDDRVDGLDFLAWQRGFGGSATPVGSGADGDANGVVDALDLDVWTDAFGAPALTALGGAALEPSMHAERIADSLYADAAAMLGRQLDDPASDAAFRPLGRARWRAMLR